MPKHTQIPAATAAPPSASSAPPIRLPTALPITVNGKPYFHEGDPAMPLLWFLRDSLRLTGSKYGCDNGQCGACSVLLDGKAVRACSLPMSAIANKSVTTIEGIEAATLHPVQQAWIEADAIQCGYCQSGQIIAAIDLLKRKPRPGEEDIASIGNLCRCGSHPQIRRAIARAAELLQGDKK
ncbi:MAG: (2Fe-2S)-binding protein [Dokdonella sp.]|uniref:(2Fe-2S)-binding protein n=1 Tax=Dokdonella sp. TaxID=2291710 RepID=UPI0025C4039F|nr:(2Fe-2S)-binding protein [Dokdonella sp.]MBZ0222813.1 (2Fe-2S)-binding protein [Dokdonella sp.]